MKNRICKTVLILTAVAMAILALATSSASAALVLEEQFDYDAGNIDGRDGGTGFNGAWASTISHGQLYATGITLFAAGEGTTINEDAGLYFSTLPVAGSALSRYGTAGRAEANRLLSTASQAALTADNTTIWFSTLISASASYKNMMFVFGTEAFGHTPGFLLAAPGDGFGVAVADADGNGDGPINAFVFDSNDIATFVIGTFSPVLQSGGTHNDTALIVGKINWKPNGTPDELYLFNVTDLATEPAEIDAIASITDKDLDQSAFDTIAMYDGSTSIIDEIRFGGSYNDVTCSGPVDAGDDVITVSGLAVPLDPDFIDGYIPTSYLWTTDAPAGFTVVFDPSETVETPTVTITQDTPSNPSAVTLTLLVNGSDQDTMTIDVYDDACLAAIAGDPELEFAQTDFDENCITNLGDFAVIAEAWLVDYEITEPVEKP